MCMKKKIPFAVFIISAFMLWGCYPNGPEYYEELDVVSGEAGDTDHRV